MSAILAIAGREVRRRLVAPTSWLIVGLFALAAGGLFVDVLNAFIDQSAQALAAPGQTPVNVNQLLLRPFFVGLGVAALLVVPLLTIRTYAGETGPSAREMTFGTFLGTLGFYALMLMAAAPHVAVLFVYGDPEWASLVTAYAGLLLSGAAAIAIGLLISSLAVRPVVAAVPTFALAIVVAAATWHSTRAFDVGPPVLRYFSIAGRLDDFAKGVIDSSHVLFFLSLAAAALFFATEARSRHRTRLTGGVESAAHPPERVT